MDMIRTYSILVLRGTQMHRFVVSQAGLRRLLLGVILLLCLSAWFFDDYLALQRKKVQELIAKAEAQQAKLSALRERTKDVREHLSRWKEFRERIHASLPKGNRASSDGQHGDDELQEVLASLQNELKQMIASLPSEWPVEGRVTSGIGMRRSPWTGEMEFHSGLDIPKPMGTRVHAAGDGIVESIDGKRGTIVLNHGQETKTQYAHLSKIWVSEGERVRKGQPIAQVGNTGRSTGPHLHYEVKVKGVPIDPRQNLIAVKPPE